MPANTRRWLRFINRLEDGEKAFINEPFADPDNLIVTFDFSTRILLTGAGLDEAYRYQQAQSVSLDSHGQTIEVRRKDMLTLLLSA